MSLRSKMKSNDYVNAP